MNSDLVDVRAADPDAVLALALAAVDPAHVWVDVLDVPDPARAGIVTLAVAAYDLEVQRAATFAVADRLRAAGLLFEAFDSETDGVMLAG